MGISGTIHLKHLSSWDGIDIIDGRGVTGGINRHLHDRDCIGIVGSGTRVISFAGGSVVKSPGAVWYIPSGTVHAVELSDEPHSYKTINFDLSYLQRYFGLPEKPVHLSMDSIKNEPECYRAIQTFCRLADEHLPLEAESYLMVILDHLSPGETVKCPPAVGDERIKTVQGYLDQHFEQPIHIESLAKMTGWSPFHLERNFRETVGLPLHQYQKMARIRRAKGLLRQGEALSYVASETGFADQSHFTRAFKDMVGITPGAYLRAYRLQTW